jgi:hypothetical protein
LRPLQLFQTGPAAQQIQDRRRSDVLKPGQHLGEVNFQPCPISVLSTL